jgi:hypothetical protein
MVKPLLISSVQGFPGAYDGRYSAGTAENVSACLPIKLVAEVGSR